MICLLVLNLSYKIFLVMVFHSKLKYEESDGLWIKMWMARLKAFIQIYPMFVALPSYYWSYCILIIYS
jgi:hypothetical protein